MKTVLEVRELVAANRAAQEAILKAADDENRDLTPDETKSFDDLNAQGETLADELTRAEKIESVRKQKATQATKSPEQKIMERHSLTRAVEFLKNGKMEGAELEIHQEAEKEAREAGIGSLQGVGLPSWAIKYDAEKRTDWNVGTDADGGYTVQKEIQPIVEPLRPVSILSQLGMNTMSGLRGNLRFPTDTAGSGAWEGEVDANANYSPTIGYVDSSPKRFGAVATLSKQLLAQSTSISDAYIRRQLELTIGTAIDIVGIKGGGSNEPTGIIGNSSVTVLSAGAASGTGVNADGAALVWGDLTKLWGAVTGANATMVSPYFLTTPGVVEKGSRSPRQSSGVEGNFIFNESLRAYTADVKFTTNVPSNLAKGSASDLHAIIFGDFNQLTLCSWGGVDLVYNPYTLAKTAQIEIIANIWVDFAITRPTCFAVIKDLVV